ncbi:DNA-binding protein HU-beta [Williamsoniiplasma somnilux]|uniref:DNA-binding protein HU-beta n=2 Tax=Williamsoniiplasma somnilux TaxID=215578 RepID=A0A2K8P060_9MOLU|nr:DNA-binding protein HU-beta [Williamsoniiplasma somnilux]
MTKKELAQVIIETEDISKSQVERIITSIFEEITNALAKGEEVSIASFGKFSVSKRAAREGINPSTGAKIKIAASKAAKFKAAKQLKEAVN